MKLCFSTLGCPDWSWDVIVSSAKDIGMDGVEVRCVRNELYAPNCAVFSDGNRFTTLSRLSELSLEIPVLDSNAVLAVPDKAEAAAKEAKDYIDLAQRMRVPYVRLMCVGVPQPVDCDLELCLRLYSELCGYGEQKGVVPLLETNGPLGDSKRIVELMNAVPGDNKGILWDVHHPYRYFGESPMDTYNRIKPYLHHVHIKDSVLADNKVSYRMLGKGDIPVKEILTLLRDFGYKEYVSLEWVKKWNPELEEAGVVFPNFARFAKRILEQ